MNVEAALDAYKRGDRLGAPWEAGPARWTPTTLPEIESRAKAYPDGTDESDIVDCFQRFSAICAYDGDLENLLVSWVRFHEKHRRATCYGGTWRDYFRLVRALDQQGNLSVGRLSTLAAEIKPGGSAGNGCLALALPVYDFARQYDLEAGALMQAFFKLSHTHPSALDAAKFLCALFDAPQRLMDRLEFDVGGEAITGFFKNREWDLSPEEFATRYPHNVLCPYTVVHALYAVIRSETEQDVICKVVSMRGDVDSVLALALMLFELVRSGQVEQEALTSCS